MSIVDTTDGDSINSNGLMVKDKRSKTGYKKASDRKVIFSNIDILYLFPIFTNKTLKFRYNVIMSIFLFISTGSSCKNRPEWETT